MARKSKSKGALPKIVVNDQFNKPKTYPTIARTGDSFRTGKETLEPFNDKTNTQIYYESVLLNAGTGVPVNNNVSLQTNVSSSMTFYGAYRAGVGDSFLFEGSNYQKLSTHSISPFREENLFAADAKSNNNEFYVSGTYPTSTYPLWSKTKIEFDLTPRAVSDCQFINDGSKNNKPMMYWNPGSKTWEALGDGFCDRGRVQDGFNTVTQQILTGTTIGFATSVGISQGSDDGFLANSGNPVVNFGFPFSNAYMPTGSQVVYAKDYITQPFVVEKIVYEFSGAFDYANYPLDQAVEFSTGHAINTFFILAQNRPSFNIVQLTINRAASDDPSSGTDITTYSPATGLAFPYIDQYYQSPSVSGLSGNPLLSKRKLIGWGQVSSFNVDASDPALQYGGREVVIQNEGYSLSWSGKYKLEFQPKMPAATKDFSTSLYVTGSNTPPYQGIYLDNRFGGRNMDGTNSGGAVVGSEFIQRQSVFTDNGIGVTDKPLSENSPYVLMPHDELVFGWQAAIPTLPTNFSLSSEFSKLRISPGAGKLIMYGSLLSENKEYTDSPNDGLTSVSINEQIKGWNAQ